MQSKILNSGARLSVAEMKGFEGVSCKLYVMIGSSNECDEKNYGISHLIEHMFFKGTKTRTSLDISQEFDKYGIRTNAFTSKTNTCYYTYGTKNTVEKSIELLSDMLFNSTFDEVELEKEKQVVIEEINMYQDMPDALCDILLDDIFFKGTNYAHDIAGTEETVKNISREQILNYIKQNYKPTNIIISLAGNISFDEAEELVNKYFERNFLKQEDFVFAPVKSNYQIKNTQKTLVKETNQAQVRIAYSTNANTFNEKEKLIESFISNMLGGGMSSRLFQEVREKLGLVYSIFCNNDSTDLTGSFVIGFGTNLKNVSLALKTIKKVIDDVVLNGFTQEELNQTKTIFISSYKLRSDSPSSVASRMVIQLKTSNKLKTKEQKLKEYEDITLEEINEHTKKMFTKDFCIAMVSSEDNIDLIDSYQK